jgi:carboxyl-terminal processing protease
VRTNETTKEIEIVSVMEGTPAMRAGILPGDVFIEVNGENIEGLSQLELVGKVRGDAGTKVTITMRRGEEFKEFVIVRARIEVPNIDTRVLDGDIGYIKLHEFNTEARHQIDQAFGGREQPQGRSRLAWQSRRPADQRD